MENMNIESAQYFADEGDEGTNVSITAVIDGVTMSVPLDPDNRHYAAIMEKVSAGTLTIAEPDPEPEPTAEQMQAEADRESAISKLEALGLTRAEINTLI